MNTNEHQEKIWYPGSILNCLQWCGESDCFAAGDSGDTSRLHIYALELEEEDRSNANLRPVCSASHSGGITDIKYIYSNAGALLVSSDTGKLSAYRFTDGYDRSDLSKLSAPQVWNAHRGAINTIAVWDNNKVVTGGDDGKINFFDLSIDGQKNLVSQDQLDGFGVKCASFLTNSQVVTGSNVLRVWDLNASENRSSILSDDTRGQSVLSLAVHPSQNHYILVGKDNGTVVCWDLRNAKHYLYKQEINSGPSAGMPIWKMEFHPTNPEYVVSCASDASASEVLLWNYNPGGSVVTAQFGDLFRNNAKIIPIARGTQDLGLTSFSMHPSQEYLITSSDCGRLTFHNNYRINTR